MRTHATLIAALAFVASAASILTPAAAEAQPAALDSNGYYARLDLGLGATRDANATGPAISGQLDDLGRSPFAGLGVGYRFNRYLRADLTTGYAWGYELDDSDAGGRAYNADIEAWTTLLNLYVEYPLGAWSPYLTAGAGISRNKVGTVTRAGLADVGGDTTTAFAWQAGLGVGYALAPSWTIDAGYRYLDAGEFKSDGDAVTGDLRSHVVMLGARYSFGGGAMPAPVPARVTPAVVPPAAPVPEPPRSAGAGIPELPVLYRVFFDWNKADLTGDATRILQDAARTARAAQAQITRIIATGHADRSGAERYNMALSLRRANAVKSALVRDGVPEDQIVVIGKGERENLSPTRDGMREQLNRRVEVLIE